MVFYGKLLAVKTVASEGFAPSCQINSSSAPLIFSTSLNSERKGSAKNAYSCFLLHSTVYPYSVDHVTETFLYFLGGFKP
jgi:hypothetical protein